MDVQFLKQLGLNETQAKAYIVLVQVGEATPVQLAIKMKTTRTNAYSILDKLVDMGLVKRLDNRKTLVYRVENPIALQNLMKKQRDESLEREKMVRDRMPMLLNYFYTYSEQPGVRFFQGKDGIKEIYLDQVRTKQPIYFIRSQADLDYYGFDFMHEMRSLAVKNGIERHVFTVDVPQAPMLWKTSDPKYLLHRTWMHAKDYTAPVEWGVYGNKVYTISFGEEAIGTIIESPQIAESFRQLFKIMDRGLRAMPDYDALPKHAKRVDKYSK